MFLILTKKNVVIDTSEDVMYVRYKNGKLEPCGEDKKEMVYIPSLNLSYDSSCYFTEVPNNKIPSDFAIDRYLYVNGEFILNPEYVVPDELRNQIIDEYTLQLIEEGVI